MDLPEQKFESRSMHWYSIEFVFCAELCDGPSLT
jgi:hypothetical protein